jgi:two-component system chemotaxis response regulator CheY
MKILIVDDSHMDRRLLISVLRRHMVKSEILQASDGEEGLSILGDNFRDIDLIFLDWQMPKMDGLEFMRTMSKIEALNHIPIIMISASGSDSDKQAAYNITPQLRGFIVKPFKPDFIMQTIREVIKLS